jgi:hypothetical protein
MVGLAILLFLVAAVVFFARQPRLAFYLEEGWKCRQHMQPCRGGRVVLCRVALTITLMAGLVVGVGACGLADRSRQANAISDAIRAIPGVAGVATGYKSDPFQGASFAPIVHLDPSITAAHAAEVVRTFIDCAHAGGFNDFVVSLTVNYPAAIPRLANNLYDSSLVFDFDLIPANGSIAADRDISARDAMAATSVWLDAVRAAFTYSASALWHPSARGRAGLSFGVTLKPGVVDDAAAAALIAGHPELGGATWQVLDVMEQWARVYNSEAIFPDAQVRDLWHEVAAQLAPEGTAGSDFIEKAVTQTDPASKQLITIIEADASAEEFPRVATTVTALLPRFGHPVQFKVFGPGGPLELTVGGCYQHQPGYGVSPLEQQLAQRYERCR